MASTLAYWNVRDVAHPIRLLLAYTGTDYEDKRYNIGPAPDFDRSEWLKDKFNLGLHFPNLPYYLDGDVKLTQSKAILRYIARKDKLDGQTEEERVRVDLIEQQLVDMYNTFGNIAYDNNFENLKADYIMSLEIFLKHLSNFLGNRPYLAGERITYVDFMAYEFLDRMRVLSSEVLTKVDNIKTFVERVEALPQIDNYLKNGPKLAIHGPFAKWGTTF